jgi:hypothetical protein
MLRRTIFQGASGKLWRGCGHTNLRQRQHGCDGLRVLEFESFRILNVKHWYGHRARSARRASDKRFRFDFASRIAIADVSVANVQFSLGFTAAFGALSATYQAAVRSHADKQVRFDLA